MILLLLLLLLLLLMSNLCITLLVVLLAALFVLFCVEPRSVKDARDREEKRKRDEALALETPVVEE
jgi:hypothetical protein